MPKRYIVRRLREDLNILGHVDAAKWKKKTQTYTPERISKRLMNNIGYATKRARHPMREQTTKMTTYDDDDDQ